MRRRRFTDEQIISILKESLAGAGPVAGINGGTIRNE